MHLQFRPENPDRYRWIALVISMIIISTAALGMTWSLLVDPMITIRGATEAGMATIYSGLTIAGAVFTIIGGKFVDKFGVTKSIISCAVMLLIGMLICGFNNSILGFAIAQVVFIGWQQAVIYISVMTTVERMFPDYRGFAVGLCACGISAGGMILAPQTQMLIESVGFDMMFVINGIILAALILVMVIFFPDYPADYMPKNIASDAEAGERKGKRSKVIANPNFVQKDWKAMLKDPAFYLLYLIPLCASSGYMLLSYQLAYIAVDILGISDMTAAFLVSGVSVMGFLSCIIGPIGDHLGRLKVVVGILIIGFIAIMGLVFCEGHGIVWFAVCTFVYCFCLGGFAGMHPSLIGDFFGSEHFAFNYSLGYTSILLAAAISPWLAVLGGDSGYSGMFMVCAIAVAVAVVLSLILLKLKGNNIEFIRVMNKDAKNEEAEQA